MAALVTTLAAAVADRIGELALAAATVVAVAALVVTLPALMRSRASRMRLTAPLVIATGGAGITFVSYLAFQLRCTRSGCGVEPGDAVRGIDPWWRLEDSWQWGAQLALASVGLTAGAVALALAARQRRRAPRALLVARVVYVAWALLAFILPAAWELLAI